MELLRPCLFICLLSSISSTTSSDPTKWKGGDGVKRSRVRRQNRNFANAGLLLEKTFAVYALCRLLDQDFDNASISITSTLGPDKLEFVTSEGPITNTNGQNDQTTSNTTGMTQSTTPQELEITPIRHQQTNSTSTQNKLRATPTSAALLSNVKSIYTFTGTTQSLLDTTEAPLNNMAITFKAVEEPSTATTQDQSYGLIGMIGTNDLMLLTSFPIDLSSPESQKTTQSGDQQLFEQPIIHFQTNKQEVPESIQVTEHYIPDSTTFASIPIEIPSKAAEEPSLATTHEQSTGSTDTTSTFKSLVSFPTRSGAPRLLDQSTQHFQTRKQKIPELRKINEQFTPGSTPFISTAKKNILEPTSVMSIPVSSSKLATKQRFPQGTSLQTAIDPHNMEPTLFPQTIKHVHSKTTLVKPVMIQGVSKHALLARTEQSTLIPSTLKLEMQDPKSHIPSVTWHDIKHTRLVMERQTKDPTTLLPIAESPISEAIAFEPTSEAEHQKPTPTTEPKHSHTEINTRINTAKSSTASLIEPFMTMKTRILTNDPSVSSKTASISTHRTLNEDPTFDSNRPGDTSVTSVAPARTYHSSRFTALPKIGLLTKYSPVSQKTHTQTQKTTSTYSIPIIQTNRSTGRMTVFHTSYQLVEGTSTQASTNGLQSSQTVPAITDKITMPNAAPSPKPSEKSFPTTSVLRQGFLPSSRAQKILSSISTKWSNFNPTETAGPRSEQANQGYAAGIMSKEPRSSNYLESDMDKSTQTIMGHKQSMTLKATTSHHMSKTQTVSDRRNPKILVFPQTITTHKPANAMNKHNLETSGSDFKLLFIAGCLIFLLILIFILVLWKRWQARHWRNNMWVAGPPRLWGMYHSVSQNSRYNPHSSVEMVEGNTHKRKQKNSYVYESTSLQQQHENII
ncbi:mucin-3B-like isoform X1 [Myxocyprinus asiaticus]|uniref:mucin-3B-like isoform X1 n=1 Tax=Myxocyprinus asiaticus TaxID=70543 RepID=UPI0022225ED1|nr:mucin-3B-like isoform X1 [Myxocyprinus asiaticus]